MKNYKEVLRETARLLREDRDEEAIVFLYHEGRGVVSPHDVRDHFTSTEMERLRAASRRLA